jgi:hypothetical protein
VIPVGIVYATGTRASKSNQVNKAPTEADIARALALLCDPADAIEIRAPRAMPPGAKAPADVVKRFPPGAFDIAAADASRLSGHAPAVYLVMNGVKPGPPPPGRKGKGAIAADVPHRRWLLIDADPNRPRDSSSTDVEKGQALKIVQAVRTHLDELGWPAPVFADSGNGWHLLYRVDLSNDGASTELVKAALHALAGRFDSARCSTPPASSSSMEPRRARATTHPTGPTVSPGS